MMSLQVKQHLMEFKSEYNEPDFWLQKLSDPDTVLLSSSEIRSLNSQIANRTSPNSNPLELEQLSEEDIRHRILEAGDLPQRVYSDGKVLTSREKEQLDASQNLTRLRSYNGDLYGLAVRRTDMRAYPSDSIITEERDDDDFDLLQHLSLDPATPLALLHLSADNQWYFCLAPYYFGWVRKADIAETPDRSILASYLGDGRFVVTTESWLELPVREESVLMQMGSRLPYARRSDHDLTLRIPTRRDGGRLDWQTIELKNYGDKVSFGYLPYTTSNIFRQAFKILGEPYAWGGSRQGQPGRDCSRFIQDVFKTVGVLLPRDSTEQCSVLADLVELDGLSHRNLQQKLRRIDPHGVVLCMPGHIMLYVGQDQGQAFAIHTLWAYSCGDEKSTEDEIVVVNKTVVTSLRIGMGSERGTFLERLTSIAQVTIQEI